MRWPLLDMSVASDERQKRDKLEFFAAQSIHSQFSFSMRTHDNESSPTRCVVYGCQNYGVADVTISRKYFHEVGSSTPSAQRL